MFKTPSWTPIFMISCWFYAKTALILRTLQIPVGAKMEFKINQVAVKRVCREVPGAICSCLQLSSAICNYLQLSGPI